jgi:hypothetical protein
MSKKTGRARSNSSCLDTRALSLVLAGFSRIAQPLKIVLRDTISVMVGLRKLAGGVAVFAGAAMTPWMLGPFRRPSDPHPIITPRPEAVGDKGVLMSNELRSPVLRKVRETSALGGWQVLGFWDYASLHAHQVSADYTNAVNASSAGVGVRYSFRTNVSAKLNYGWALRTIPGTQTGSSMASISLTVGN